MTRRLGREIQPLADRIMNLLLQLIQTAGKQSPVIEDAFLAIGALSAALEADFQKYLPAFLPFLSNALGVREEYQLCSIAVGLIGDVCRALGEASAAYAQPFMEGLLSALQSPVLHRSVKPPILSCFGDLALAIGPSFEPFLDTTMKVLQQAGLMRADPVQFFFFGQPACGARQLTKDPFFSPITISSIMSIRCVKVSLRLIPESLAASRLAAKQTSFCPTLPTSSPSSISL